MAQPLTAQAERTRQHYRRAAEAGDVDAMYNLGVLLEGLSLPSSAARWYRQAAKAGDVDAMFNLAGVLEDLARTAEAKHWYARAAQADDVDAKFNLSLLEGQCPANDAKHFSDEGSLSQGAGSVAPERESSDGTRSGRATPLSAQGADPSTGALRPWYRKKRGRRLLAAASLPAVLGLLLAACQDELTPDGSPYGVSVNGSTFTVTNSSSGGNEREALIPSSEPTEASSTSCATWDSGASFTQNGIVFRGTSAPGGWDGVVIERSIYLAGFWDFVVIYFHGGTFDTGPSVDLSGYLGHSEVWPLRMCAQITSAASGSVLSFAVAKGSDPMVPDGTPTRGGTFLLNAGDMPASGQTGSYIAHVPQGTSAIVGDVSIDGKPAPSPLS